MTGQRDLDPGNPDASRHRRHLRNLTRRLRNALEERAHFTAALLLATSGEEALRAEVRARQAELQAERLRAAIVAEAALLRRLGR